MVKVGILILTAGLLLYGYVNVLPVALSYLQKAVVGTSVIPEKVKEVKKKVDPVEKEDKEPNYEEKAEEVIDELLHIR
ncbi:hypothetical protein [Persephonella sp.]